MKKISFLLLGAMLLSQPAFAGQSPFYMAMKIGMVDNGGAFSDSAINGAFDIGYRHNRFLSTEFEISETFVDGKSASGNNWQANSWSLFAALRTDTDIKLKGKIGLSNFEGGDGFNLASGLGISYWSGGALVEIEFTRLDDGVSFISWGANFFF